MAFILAAFYFFYFAIVAVYIIFMPKVLENLGYLPSEIGILFAAAPLVRFLIPFLFLKHIRLSTQVFNFALILAFISSLLIHIFITHFWFLLVLNITLGIGMSLVLPYVESLALSRMPKEMYGKVRLFGSVGFILVSLVLVNYLDNAHNAIGFLNATTGLSMLFGFLLIRYEKESASPLSLTDDESFTLLTHWPLWISLFLMQVGFGGFYNFFTIYTSSFPIGMESLGVKPIDMSVYLWSFGVICEIFMLYFQGPLLHNRLIKLLMITVAFTVLRWLLLAFFPNVLSLLFLSQSIHALSFALYHSAAIMYLHSLYSNKKLSQQFFAGIAYGLGGFLGASISGFIYEITPQGLYITMAMITLLSLLFLLVQSRRPNA